MRHRHRDTPRPTWLTWDNYLLGVLGLAATAALATVAATVALSGHHIAAAALATAALLFAVPAAVQVIGELLDILLLIGTLAGLLLLSPALLASPALRRRAAAHWAGTWR